MLFLKYDRKQYSLKYVLVTLSEGDLQKIQNLLVKFHYLMGVTIIWLSHCLNIVFFCLTVCLFFNFVINFCPLPITFNSEAARGSWLAVLLGVQSMDWGGGEGGLGAGSSWSLQTTDYITHRALYMLCVTLYRRQQTKTKTYNMVETGHHTCTISAAQYHSSQ